MAIDDQANEEAMEQQAGIEPMPGTSIQDPVTYDPTQGAGTDAWQLAVRRQKEHNVKMNMEHQAKLRRN